MRSLPDVRTDLIVSTVQDEVLVFDQNRNEVLGLQPLAATTFRACADRVPRADLAAQIGEAAMESALAELATAGLLAGTTRRQLLTRSAVLGGGLVAGGMVMAVTAPAASAAVSGGGTGGSGGGVTPGVVYSNDFSTSAQAPGGTIAAKNGSPGITNHGGASYLGQFNNDTVTLTIPKSALSGSQYRLQVKFYAIQTWDGDGPAGGNSPQNPDKFIISDNNGHTPLDASFANYGGNTQSYPSGISQGNSPKTGNSGQGVLGFGNGDAGDTEYTFDFLLPLSTSQNLVISFRDTLNQGLGDEEWGLRNLTVTTVA